MSKKGLIILGLLGAFYILAFWGADLLNQNFLYGLGYSLGFLAVTFLPPYLVVDTVLHRRKIKEKGELDD